MKDDFEGCRIGGWLWDSSAVWVRVSAVPPGASRAFLWLPSGSVFERLSSVCRGEVFSGLTCAGQLPGRALRCAALPWGRAGCRARRCASRPRRGARRGCGRPPKPSSVLRVLFQVPKPLWSHQAPSAVSGFPARSPEAVLGPWPSVAGPRVWCLPSLRPCRSRPLRTACAVPVEPRASRSRLGQGRGRRCPGGGPRGRALSAVPACPRP